MKKMILAIVIGAMSILLCACGELDESSSASVGSADSSEVTTTTTTTTTTTANKPAEESMQGNADDDYLNNVEIFTSPDDVVKFETIAELEAHLEQNYSDTVYSIPEYDEEKYTVKGCSWFPTMTCGYYIFFEASDGTDVTYYAEAAETPLTFEEYVQYTQENFPGLVDEIDYENKVMFEDDVWDDVIPLYIDTVSDKGNPIMLFLSQKSESDTRTDEQRLLESYEDFRASKAD